MSGETPLDGPLDKITYSPSFSSSGCSEITIGAGIMATSSKSSCVSFFIFGGAGRALIGRPGRRADVVSVWSGSWLICVFGENVMGWGDSADAREVTTGGGLASGSAVSSLASVEMANTPADRDETLGDSNAGAVEVGTFEATASVVRDFDALLTETLPVEDAGLEDCFLGDVCCGGDFGVLIRGTDCGVD